MGGGYEFSGFYLDTQRMRLLREDGEVVALPPKAFDLLRMLVESNGRVLTKEELFTEVWRGTIVEEGNLTQTISILRKALGENRSDHRYIVTVPGRGYRFVADVHKRQSETDEISSPKRTQPASHTLNELINPAADHATPDDTPQPTVPPPEEVEQKARLKSARPRIVGLLVVLGLLTVAVYQLSPRWRRPRSQALPASIGEVRSIAVLPFESLGAEQDHEYLGLGITDALITKLSNISRIVVRPTDSVLKYSDAKPTMVDLGKTLKVDALLDGRVQRAEDRIRVTVQLVRSSDGVPLWAEAFDDRFTNFFAVQDSISQKVAQAMLEELTGEERRLLGKKPTESTEAYQLYLKGRFFWNKRTGESLEKSLEYFSEATRVDPQFALAYAGMAEAYVILNLYSVEQRRDAFPKAREAALRALALDDTLAAAYTALALVKLEYDYDWSGAEQAYRTALSLNPNYATAHHWFSEYLAFQGRFEESVAHIERAYEIEPQSPVINAARGYPYLRARRCDQAPHYFRKALEMEPGLPLARFYLGKCYVDQGEYENAIGEHLKAIEASGESPMFMAALGYAYARSGKRGQARTVLRLMEEASRRRYVSPYSFATVYAGLDDPDRAFEWLRKAYDERDGQLVTIKDDIHFDRLRGDQRFDALLGLIGLTTAAEGSRGVR